MRQLTSHCQLEGAATERLQKDLRNHATDPGHRIRCQFVFCRCLRAPIGPGSPHRPQVGRGGPAQAPVRRQARTAPADQWGWTDPRLCTPNSIQPAGDPSSGSRMCCHQRSSNRTVSLHRRRWKAVLNAHLQQRRLHLQRADLAGRLQHLRLRQTRSSAQSGKPAAEDAGSRPRRAGSGPVPPQNQHPGSGLVPRTGCPRPAVHTERGANTRRTRGRDGLVRKALSDHSQSQLPQEMRR